MDLKIATAPGTVRECYSVISFLGLPLVDEIAVLNTANRLQLLLAMRDPGVMRWYKAKYAKVIIKLK